MSERGWMIGLAGPCVALALGLAAGCGDSGPGTPPGEDLGHGDLSYHDAGPGGDAGGDALGEDGPPGPDASPCGGSCDDNLSCTDDSCEAGTCKNELKAGHCLIDGVCYKEGQTQARGGCATCKPASSTSAWTDDAIQCKDDGLVCTDAVCTAGTCSHQTKTGSCLISGSCYNTGDPNPAADCEACDPTQSATAFSAVADGTACTADSLSCTDDVCKAGSCSHPVTSGSCLIGGACFTSGDTNPKAECQRCDPVQSATGWSDKPDNTACTADSLSCTADVCVKGSCTHPVSSGACLITGVCYSAGAKHPSVECMGCVPATSSSGWSTLADGTSCAPDPHSCTDDVCSSGTCTHPLKANMCLISGACYADGATVGAGGCEICIAAQSTSAAVFAAGKACDDGDTSTTMDTCLGSSCTGFGSGSWEWLSSDTETALSAVGEVPGDGVWAAGSYVDAGDVDGVLVRVDSASSLSGATYDEQPFRGVHDRMAVGAAGQARYFNGSSWATAAPVETHLGSGAVAGGVWGAQLSAVDRVFFIAASGGTLARCLTANNGTSFSCSNHSGASGDMLRVFGTLGASGGQGPLWAIRGDSYEDIFYNAGGSTTTWSTSAPTGCFDSSSSPCGATPGRFLDLWASGDKDVWAVGEQGLVMRYDGSAWSKVSIPGLGSSAPQGNYTFRGVWSGGDLVVLVGERAYGTSFHDLVAVFHNRKLKQWYAPRLLLYTQQSDPNKDAYRLNDVVAVGSPAAKMTLVGSTWVSSASEQRALVVVAP